MMLDEYGVNHEEHPVAAGTTRECKRKKVATLLRVRFDYSTDLTLAEKKELLENAREFISKKPQILRMSERAIEKRFSKAA
jgi:hypothetical protein